MSSITKNLTNKLNVNINQKKKTSSGDAGNRRTFYVYLGFNNISIGKYQNLCTDTLLLLIRKDL